MLPGTTVEIVIYTALSLATNTGPMGPTGYTGPTGTGITGPTGETGPISTAPGPTGPTGPQSGTNLGFVIIFGGY